MKSIAWDKVTWYSKTIALALFVALPFAGFYLGVKYGKLSAPFEEPAFSISSTAYAPASPASRADAYYRSPAEWQTDTNSRGGFTIAYPIDFDAQDNYNAAAGIGWRLGATTTGNSYFTLTVPPAFEPQTNFADATLVIGSSRTPQAIAQCMDPSPNGMPGGNATSTATVNGTTFTVFHSGDAGAGNYYETTSYRTLHAGQCYAVEYTVHSSQIANYPSSYNLQPFDQAKIDSLMQAIIGTFKFQ